MDTVKIVVQYEDYKRLVDAMNVIEIILDEIDVESHWDARLQAEYDEDDDRLAIR